MKLGFKHMQNKENKNADCQLCTALIMFLLNIGSEISIGHVVVLCTIQWQWEHFHSNILENVFNNNAYYTETFLNSVQETFSSNVSQWQKGNPDKRKGLKPIVLVLWHTCRLVLSGWADLRQILCHLHGLLDPCSWEIIIETKEGFQYLDSGFPLAGCSVIWKNCDVRKHYGRKKWQKKF